MLCMRDLWVICVHAWWQMEGGLWNRGHHLWPESRSVLCRRRGGTSLLTHASACTSCHVLIHLYVCLPAARQSLFMLTAAVWALSPSSPPRLPILVGTHQNLSIAGPANDRRQGMTLINCSRSLKRSQAASLWAAVVLKRRQPPPRSTP